jgi:hypothetical protein
MRFGYMRYKNCLISCRDAVCVFLEGMCQDLLFGVPRQGQVYRFDWNVLILERLVTKKLVCQTIFVQDENTRKRQYGQHYV